MARFTDPGAAKHLVDRLNADSFAIPGTLSSIDIARRESAGVPTLTRIPFGFRGT